MDWNEDDLPDLIKLYEILFSRHGPQGWWPLIGQHRKGANPTKRGVLTSYHVGNYDLPETETEMFEVMVGAILTQNTSWVQAEAALINLHDRGILSIEGIRDASLEELAKLIYSSGFYNQKALRLKTLVEFLEKNPMRVLESMDTQVLRKKLLSIKGVGNETTDSIILYALKKPVFVIDAYTKRFLSRMGYINKSVKYLELQKVFHERIEKNHKIYNEYHALIVQHSVHYCTSKPKCDQCMFNNLCKKLISVKK
ncbi:MAG: endonuclease III domain-containing protein [Promethearchaeota archaeon]